ncbi:methyl-accepting chemotaxis protein [Sporomusa aerivorans]|uniref:methyl-accepting chemotaxis protein n=1 Tax=Sporomusa aerivorans TaxID=204936 RepID=UPI00352B1123
MKKRLIAIMLCVSCIPLIIATAIYYHIFELKLSNDYHEASLQNAEMIQKDVRYFINRNMDALRLLAKNQTIISMDRLAMKSILVSVGKDYPDMLFGVIDMHGQQISRSDNLALTDVADRPFFKKAASGQENISEVLIGRATNQPIIAPAVPIKDESGNVHGVIQGALALNILNDFVKQRSINGSTVFIVDQSGRIIAHPDTNLTPEEKDLSKLEYIQNGLRGQNGTIKTNNREGENVVIYYVFDKERQWLTCIETPNDILVAQSRKIMPQMLLLLVVTILLVGTVGWFIAGKIINPLSILVIKFKEIAGGNLAVKEIEVNSRDEIGELSAAFNTMLDYLRKIVLQVDSAAAQVASSSQQLTASTQESALVTERVVDIISDLARGLDSQISSINDASKVVNRISSAIQQVATNTDIVATSSNKTGNAAAIGEKAISAAINQMTNIEKVVTNSAATVGKLGESSKEIGQIIDAISNIAGQTNLLALNAAIEAARAGEQGRGFAVVAEEVRKLAEQSQDAAKKIEMLVGEIQGETAKAVTAMADGVQAVNVGTEVVSKAGSAFNEISVLIQEVSQHVSDTSAVVNQTSKYSQQIVGSIKKIEEVCLEIAEQSKMVSTSTEEESASMQEIAASSQALAEMSMHLTQVISVFKF